VRIAIAGAGWFGCHIAETLLEHQHEVTVFESRSSIFAGASGNNTNRLHLGFHYPRSKITREQSKQGYWRFLEKYPTLSRPAPYNLYAIARQESFVDFPTYLQIMDVTGLTYNECDPAAFGLENVAGSLDCPERVIDSRGAQGVFASRLAGCLRLSEPVSDLHLGKDSVRVNGGQYDLFVDCTYQSLLPNRKWDLAFEPCITLVYEGPDDHGGITVMDGPFFTIYPDNDNLFTVYSVTHTPRGRFHSPQQAFKVLSSVGDSDVARVRTAMEIQIARHYPTFKDRFRFAGVRMTVRTRTRDMADARASVVEQQDRGIQVLSGKIDSIFFVADEILKCVEAHEPSRAAALNVAGVSPATNWT